MADNSSAMTAFNIICNPFSPVVLKNAPLLAAGHFVLLPTNFIFSTIRFSDEGLSSRIHFEQDIFALVAHTSLINEIG